MEMSNMSDAEFKTLVVRMLKELSEDLNRIKKSQAEMKDILTEMNNLQGIKSTVDKAKNQNNDMKHKQTKNNQSEQQEEKRIQIKEESAKTV